MSHDPLQAAGILFLPGQVVEVRALMDEGMASGYFDDLGKLADQVATLDGLPGVQGIYVTLNEVNPALLSRRANRIKSRLSKKDATTADTDIVHRHWFPVDVDPARPSGVSSTDEEHQAAIDTAARVSEYLAGLGWPDPIVADSGNGAHLLYRVDLPNDDRSRELVKRCLEILAALFDDGITSIDTANHNAARIWKLYGTMSRKGDNTPDRPHRRSALISVPEEVEVVPGELLEGLASALPSASPDPVPHRGKGSSKFLDLNAWLREHGIGIAREKPYEGGTLYVLDECPFSGAHRDGAFAIQFPNGAIHAGCQHASCGGGSQRWQELREKFEPRDKRTRAKSPAPGMGSQGKASPPSDPDDLPGRAEALTVLQHGNPKQAMLRAFALDHEGDEVVAECLALSLASRSVENTHGLHVSVTGESGKGKSHAFNTMLQQVPERLRLADRMSNKALFYMENPQPGSAIVLDDRGLSEEMAEILKGVTTSFRKPFHYLTVSTDRKGMRCTIPERCIWWVAKVEGVGDDQVFNRMLTCWIDDSAEQDDRCLARSLHRDAEIPVDEGEESLQVLTCRAMWEEIGARRFHVVIPFALRIQFSSHSNRRNPEMLLDLIKANAVLRFMQREQIMSGRIRCLMATLEDFDEAARLYGLLNGTSGGQETKLTRKEADLLQTIREGDWGEFTIPQLQRVTGLSNNTIHRLIHGYSTHGKTYSGLLEKCPAVAYTDRTVVSEEEGGSLSMRRRTNAYTFDRGVYEIWSGGGSVWLDGGEGPGGTSTSDGSESVTICPTIPRQSHGNRMENDASQNIDSAGSDCAEAPIINNIFLSTPLSHGKTPIAQNPDDHDLHGTVCACDAGISMGQVPGDANPSENGLNEDQIEETADDVLRHTLEEAQKIPRDCGEGPVPMEGSVSTQTRSRINARDYKPLEVPDHVSCHVCGSSWTHYIEKLTEERKKRPKDQLKAYQVCKRCYAAAKRKAQESAVILPGTYDLSRLERLKSSVGRCTICELDSAVYIDRSTGTKLCEVCYQRVSGSPDHGEVSG
ncbi:MAG TPA: hypothetical protein PLM60_04560 [Methanoregulaceae archaeon]|nr:hypothetical protein [Methanoregulaceae archaeon]HPS22661.1 hypothetical protein [Methanoregulaceae archaeon]